MYTGVYRECREACIQACIEAGFLAYCFPEKLSIHFEWCSCLGACKPLF